MIVVDSYEMIYCFFFVRFNKNTAGNHLQLGVIIVFDGASTVII